MADRWQTLTEACQTLGISQRTLYRRINKGEIESKVIDGRRMILVTLPDDKDMSDSLAELSDSGRRAQLEAENEGLRADIERLNSELKAAKSQAAKVESQEDHIQTLKDQLQKKDTQIGEKDTQISRLYELLAIAEGKTIKLIEDQRDKPPWYRRLWRGHKSKKGA